ncbi:hypothetical protein D3C76_1623000 [compost metagenome]
MSAIICACCSGLSQAVELTTKHAASNACWRILTSICEVNSGPANEPGYIEAWICSPSAIKA